MLWLTAHLTLEWLFHATKPSIVSSAQPSVQLLLLTATPATFFAWILPTQAVLAWIDSFRRSARVRWLAALLPALLATVLILILVDNFTRTLFGAGIANTRGAVTAVYFAATVFVALWIWQKEGAALAVGKPSRRVVVAAGALVILTLVVSLAWARPAGRVQDVWGRARAERRPNILFVGLDGVEAGMTSAYSPGATYTPTLESLREKGVLFENAFSNSGRTYGSLTSLLTGKPPVETGVIFPPDYLEGANSFEHLPMLLRAAGYRNAQVGVQSLADANDLNIRGGFDVVNGRPGLKGSRPKDISKAQERVELYRSQVIERVLDRVPHILFIRMMQDEYRFLVRKEPADLLDFADTKRLALAEEFIRREPEPWFVHVHLLGTHGCNGCASAVKEIDASVGSLLNILRQTGQLDRTLIVVYSDHSRAWGTMERLPLIIVPPDGSGPRTVRNNVQLIDVAPTVLAFLGIARPPWMSGHPLLETDPPAARPIYSRSPFTNDQSAGVVLHERWATIDFRMLEFRSGAIAGHTAPRREADFDQRALTLLKEHVRTGYVAK